MRDIRSTGRLERALTALGRAERRGRSSSVDAKRVAVIDALREAIARAAPRQARLPFLGALQGGRFRTLANADLLAELRHYQNVPLPIDEKRLAIGDMVLQFLDEMADRRVRPR
jgi:hypothetical protein